MLSDDQTKLSQRFERAVRHPRLMMLYPPVSTGEPYDGTPDALGLWKDSPRSGTLYVHVPFCAHRCAFCPFHATVPSNGDCEAYIGAVLAEASLYAPAVEHVSFTSVYFGGGTPSLLPPDQFERLMGGLGRHLSIESADVTIEAHPTDVNRSRLRDWCAAGVTRLSLGVQSFDPVVLEACGRGDTIGRVVESAEAAFNTPLRDVNLDFMYGLPEQTFESWMEDLRVAERLGVQSMTLYATVYLPGFEDWCHKRNLTIPTAAQRRTMYEMAYDHLNSTGYPQPHYGAGAFLSGELNPHRRNVSLGLPTLGLGTWAYSSSGGFAYHNTTPAADWAREVQQGRLPIDRLVRVPERERARKYIIEALLLAYVDLEHFRSTCGVGLDQAFPEELALLERLGLTQTIDGELCLTRAGGRHLREIRYLFASDSVVEALEADAEQGL